MHKILDSVFSNAHMIVRVTNAYNLSTLEVEAGESETEGYLRLHRKFKARLVYMRTCQKQAKYKKNELIQVEMYIIDLRLLF